jgi:hypothetical protein
MLNKLLPMLRHVDANATPPMLARSLPKEWKTPSLCSENAKFFQKKKNTDTMPCHVTHPKQPALMRIWGEKSLYGYFMHRRNARLLMKE